MYSDRTPKRIIAAFDQTAFVLGELRRGYKTDAISRDVALICPPIPADDLSYGMARIWRYRLGPMERGLLLFTALYAAEPADVEYFGKLAFVMGSPPPFGRYP